MVDRNRGEKSYERIDRSSEEKNGKTAPDTTGARLRIPGPIRRPGATLRWRFRNYKTRFWFQEGREKIFGRTAGLPTFPGILLRTDRFLRRTHQAATETITQARDAPTKAPPTL